MTGIKTFIYRIISFGVIQKILSKIKIRKHLKENFSKEIALLKGTHVPESSKNSIMHFTVHRSASRYVTNILKNLSKCNDITYIHLEGYYWRGGQIFTDPHNMYKPSGYCYGPFLGLDKEELTVPIPNMDEFRVILMLRDPRDVLTSYYFHHAHDPYFNPAQEAQIAARSKEAQSMSIDDWVKDKAPLFKSRYEEYLSKLYGKPNVLFLKYEDMIENFPDWFEKVVEFTGLTPDTDTRDLIMKTANFKVANEVKSAHKRQVAPGDHVRKLSVDTIAWLNSEFKVVLKELNY